MIHIGNSMMCYEIDTEKVRTYEEEEEEEEEEKHRGKKQCITY